MPLIEHRDLVQGTQEWLDARLGMVTASVVDRLIATRSRSGIDYGCMDCFVDAGEPCVSKKRGDGPATPIKTLHPARIDAARTDNSPPELTVANTDESNGLTALLVAERITGYSDPVFVNDDMRRGTEEEPRARDLYSEHYAPARETGFLVREEADWRLGYSPDGLVGDDGLIEVKAPRAKTHIRTILSGEIPAHHMPQIQAGLLVTGREWLDFVSWCGGLPMWVKRTYPDQRWFDAITAACQQFETTAAQMVADYERLTEGLPQTERIDYDLEMVI